MKKKLWSILLSVFTFAFVVFLISCGGNNKKYNVTFEYNENFGLVAAYDDSDNAKTEFSKNEVVNVKVQPNEGYYIDAFTVNEVAQSVSNNLYSFTIKEDTNIVTVFKEVPKDSFSVTIGEVENGSVKVYDASNNEKLIFEDGDTVEVRVEANEGYALKAFKVNNETKNLTNGTYSFTISANTTINAEFVKNQYKVNVNYAEKHAEVKLNDAALKADNTFDHGTVVKVSITAKDGYEVSSVKVDGTKVELTNGAYSFTLSKDTTINVVTNVAKLTDEMLATVQGTMHVSGSYIHSEGETPTTTSVNSIVTIFGTDSVYTNEKDNKGTLTYEAVYVNKNGFVALAYHDVKNAMQYNVSEEKFEDYYNPFVLLKVEDFEAVGDEPGYFKLKDSAKARAAACAITGWDESIGEFKIYVNDDGNVESIFIETADDAVSNGEPYSSSYTFAISGWGNTELEHDLLNPYATSDEHKALKDALLAAAEYKNYTISYLDKEDGEPDVEYKMYITETAIYTDCVGYESGYVQEGNYVYPFDYYPNGEEKVVLSDPISGITSINNIRAGFIGFAPEIFEYVGNGVFVLRDGDFAGDVLQEFADGIDKMKLYSKYTYSATITIKDGALYSVSGDYYVYGVFGSFTQVYTNVNKTVLPIDFEDAVKTSVLDSYVGTYSDGEHTLVVDATTGVTFDGEEVVVQGYDSENGVFTVTYQDETYYFGKQSKNQVIIFNDDETVVFLLLLQTEEEVEIPNAYKGAWYGIAYEKEDSKSVPSYESTIIIISNHVYIDGIELDIISFDEEEGLICMDGDVTYIIYTYEYEENLYLLVELSKDNHWLDQFYIYSEKEEMQEVPDDLVGTYEKEDPYTFNTYKLVIRPLYVYFYINEEAQPITIISSKIDELYGGTVYVEIDGITYVIGHGYNDTVVIASEEDNGHSLYVTLNKVEDEEIEEPIEDGEIPESFYGNFINEEGDYQITIDDTGVYVTMGSNPEVKAEEVTYDPSWGEISFVVNGETFYMCSYGGDTNNVETLFFSNSDWTIKEYLDRVEGDIPSVFVGTFEGEDGWTRVSYKIVGTPNKIKVWFGEEEKEVTVTKIEYDEDNGYTIYVDIDGKEHTIFEYGEGTIVLNSWYDNGNSIWASLTKKSGSNNDPTSEEILIPEKYYGYYMDADETSLITIDESGIYVIIDDGDEVKVEIVEYSNSDGFTISLNDGTYYIYQANYDYEDFVTKICFIKEDYTNPIMLNKVITIPSEYVGVYEGTSGLENDDSTCRLEITKDEIKVWIDETEKEVKLMNVESDYYSSTIIIEMDDTLYSISSWYGSIMFTSLVDYGETFSYELKVPYEGIPEKYYGEYMDEECTYIITINSSGIFVMTDEDENEVEAEVEDYSDYNGFTLKINGETYYLGNAGHGEAINKIYFMDENNNYKILNKDGSEEESDEPSQEEIVIPTKFYGDYATSTYDYYITIDEDGIFVVINYGSEMEAKIEEYTESEGFVVILEGTTYYISSTSYDETVEAIRFMSEDYTVFVTLTKLD